MAQQDRARPDRVGDRRRRRHHQRRADRDQRGPAPRAARGQRARRAPAAALKLLGRAAPRPDRARAPAQRRAAHRPLDGRAPGASPRASGASRARSRTSSPRPVHQHLAAAYDRGFFDDLVTPYLGLERDQNLRPDSTVEKLAKLRTGVRRRRRRDDDRRQLDAADRRRLGRAARQRGVGAPSASCPCWPTSSTPRPRRSTTCDGERGPADGARATRCRGCSTAQRPDPAGLRLLRDPRGVRRRRCWPRSRPGRTRPSAASGSASTSRSARSTARS